MNSYSTFAYTFFLNLLFVASSFAQFQYISPKPGSIYHNPETNIILKAGAVVNPASLKNELVKITGSESGDHLFKIVLASDKKTILFYTTVKFAFEEEVTVHINSGFETKSGIALQDTAFSFKIHPARSTNDAAAIQLARKHIYEDEFGEEETETGIQKNPPECTFPEVNVISNGNEYVAPVFMRNQRLNDNICFAREIMSNIGDSIYAVFDEFAGIDFKINHNGYLTYFDKNDSTFMMMDSNYIQVKKFHMGNGYPCDEHEFLVYPNGHSFLMSYDAQIVDMSVIVSGGAVNAVVLGLVLQELDEADNVIFQWRSWDHMQITDAVNQVCLTCLEIDYVHGNSIEIDTDDNLLVSCRHLSAIVKINRTTGEIMWQMGGENNQFTFTNETGISHFYYQHHFRLLEDGNYSMFNNANYQIPQASAAKIYSLDQTAKTATLVWEYVHPKIIGYNEALDYYVYGRAMGSVQPLPDGNWLIGWGLLTNTNLAPFPNVTEVDNDGNIVWELRYTDSTLVSYRSFKFDFIRCGYIADSSLALTYIGSDSVDLVWDNSNNASSYLFQYKLTTSSDWITIPVATNSISLNNLQQQSVYDWRVQSICDAYNDSSSVTETHQFTTIVNGVGNVINNNGGFNLYPNPSSTTTTVTSYVAARCQVLIVVINLLGGVVYENKYNAVDGVNKFEIPVKQFPRGIYTVKMSDNRSVYTRQLILE